MLDTLMKVGAHRIEYFESVSPISSSAFGFYIRGEKNARDIYSREAKFQLYAGLVLIQENDQMRNLAGIYVDVDALENLLRPAYVQLKKDLVSGRFNRLFVLDESALLGLPAADEDVCNLYIETGGFELMVCCEGECVAIDVLSSINP